VFTGGIGENSSMVRDLVLSELGFLGIQLDDKLNRAGEKGEREISIKGSRVKIFVIPTNEELVIALDTMRIISKNN
jgi:acetate kinase